MQPKRFCFPIQVYFEDTDAGGIVYYANYLKFFERARTEWLRSLGISQQKLLQQNIAFVVTKVAMDLKASARLDDQLIVESEISQLKKASMVFKQQLRDNNNRLLTEAEIKIACVNLAQHKACMIPRHILGVLSGDC